MPRSPSLRPSLVALLLALLLVWSVGLRVWFGSHDLQIHRFWDEKFNIPNVHSALEQGSLTPVRYAYLRLSYLPQVAVLGALQVGASLFDPDFSWFRDDVFTPGGFLVVRSTQALIGGLSILLTFLVGRYLFSPGVGLLGAFLVAASPTHLIFSGVFKPDILAVTTTLLALALSLRAVDRPTVWRYVGAGIGIGLAISSKPTAGVIAIPLTLVALILGWKDRRHWLGLAVAGATSVLLFVVLNPYPRYLRAFALQRKRYDQIAAQKGSLGDPLAALRQELVTAFPWAHGAVLGAIALAGVVFLMLLTWRHRSEGKKVLQVAMLWIYPVTFLPLYAVITQNVLPQNLLPLLPFTSLAAAALLAAVWRFASGRWRWLADPRVAVPAGLSLALLVSFPSTARAYRVVVPTTREVALRQLVVGLPADHPRSVIFESEGTTPDVFAGEPGPAKQLPQHFVTWSPARSSDLAHATLNRSDAEVFAATRTVGRDADFYLERTSRDPRDRILNVESRPFQAWGPDLVVIFHPWNYQGSTTVELSRSAENNWFEYPLSGPTGVEEVVSLEFWARSVADSKRPLRVEAGNEPVDLKRRSRRGGQSLWITSRISLTPGSELPIRIQLPGAPRDPALSVVIRRWDKSL